MSILYILALGLSLVAHVCQRRENTRLKQAYDFNLGQLLILAAVSQQKTNLLSEVPK